MIESIVFIAFVVLIVLFFTREDRAGERAIRRTQKTHRAEARLERGRIPQARQAEQDDRATMLREREAAERDAYIGRLLEPIERKAQAKQEEQDYQDTMTKLKARHKPTNWRSL